MRPFFPPLIAGVAAGAGSWFWGIYPKFADASSAMGFGGTIASMATTMLGFMLAALAVLASINHTHLVKMMRQQGHYDDLLLTMFVGCLMFMACAIFGYSLLFGAPCSSILLNVILGVHAASLVSLIDVGRKLWFVLSNLRSS